MGESALRPVTSATDSLSRRVPQRAGGVSAPAPRPKLLDQVRERCGAVNGSWSCSYMGQGYACRSA